MSCRSPEEQRTRLIKRHLETWSEEKTRIWGDGPNGGAAAKADSNDMINARYVEETSKKYADRIIISE